MVDSCYICGRSQADLDRLNEEVRARVYLSYFSSARGQIDEQQRKITFLQRLRDEESGDPHFRIGAPQVFADPTAYQKLMPWIDTLIEIAGPAFPPAELRGTIGELVEKLLSQERALTTKLEQALERIRAAFSSGARSPMVLREVGHAFPVEWAVDDLALAWRASQPGDREPLVRTAGSARPTVEIRLHLCTVCQALIGQP
jgi:hypothetical protein